jgi:single-stranded-DNA-specific exonuclease
VLTSLQAADALWRLKPAADEHVEILARELRIPRSMARAIVVRGFEQPASARDFLTPRLKNLTPPTDMADLRRAIERISRAVVDGELVGVFGDYDVDGVTSAALLGDYLSRCEAKVTLRVARRDEGYGFGVSQADELLERGISLLIVADCGTSDHDAVTRVQKAGVDVIALDHHRVKDGHDFPGFALVNPQRPDCGFPDKGLCSAGLCFYAMAALRRELEGLGRKVADPRDNLDLVALATIADVAPLSHNNRTLVARGLHRLAKTDRPGLVELMRLCEIEKRTPTTEDIGWRIAPRLNAPGRLGDAGISLQCLFLRDEGQAIAFAKQCDALNLERREIQQSILDQARKQVESRPERSFVLVADEGWHPGVIGIVAGRLCEEYEKPAAVVAIEGASGRGSARSVEGVDLFALLSACGEHMLRYGGHAAAAGFTVAREQIEALSEALDGVTRPVLAGREQAPIVIDSTVDLSEIDFSFCRELQKLGPYGEGNEPPLFAASAAKVEMARAMGDKHIRMALRQGNVVRHAVGFGMIDHLPEVGQQVDIAFVPEIDNFGGPRVRLKLAAIKAAGHGLPLRS